MKRTIIPATLTLIAAPALAGQAAWEVADRYVCTAESLRICRPDRPACRSGDGGATLLVDFAAGTFRTATGDPQFTESIVWRRFQQFDSGTSIHVAMMSGGARMLQFYGGRRTGGPSGPGMNAVFVTAYGGSVYTSYLFCAEQP